MSRVYSCRFKKELMHLVVDEHLSTSQTALKYGVPLKTMEKWITEYRKNPSCFDKPDNEYQIRRKKEQHKYDKLNQEELIHECKLRDARIQFLESCLLAEQIKNS